ARELRPGLQSAAPEIWSSHLPSERSPPPHPLTSGRLPPIKQGIFTLPPEPQLVSIASLPRASPQQFLSRRSCKYRRWSWTRTVFSTPPLTRMARFIALNITHLGRE